LADISELKFRKMNKEIKKLNFQSVYSVSMGEIAFISLKPTDK